MVFVPTLCHQTLHQYAPFNREFLRNWRKILPSAKEWADSMRAKMLVLAPSSPSTSQGNQESINRSVGKRGRRKSKRRMRRKAYLVRCNMTYVQHNTTRTSFHTPTILVQTETENCMTAIAHLLRQLDPNIDGTIQPKENW